MSALPANAGLTALVVRPVGTISVCCAVVIFEITSSTSSIDCVEKLQVRITEPGLVPVAACAMPRCALVSWQSCRSVASVIVLQSAGADLNDAYRSDGPMALPFEERRPSVSTTR